MGWNLMVLGKKIGDEIMEIKIMGPGGPRCTETEKIVKDAVVKGGVAATGEQVRDFPALAQHGVLATPAVVMAGGIKWVGRLPSASELAGWRQ
jgi:small redox-active disulfide protein 2